VVGLPRFWKVACVIPMDPHHGEPKRMHKRTIDKTAVDPTTMAAREASQGPTAPADRTATSRIATVAGNDAIGTSKRTACQQLKPALEGIKSGGTRPRVGSWYDEVEVVVEGESSRGEKDPNGSSKRQRALLKRWALLPTVSTSRPSPVGRYHALGPSRTETSRHALHPSDTACRAVWAPQQFTYKSQAAYPEKGARITLTPKQVDECVAIGLRRRQENARNGTVDRQFSRGRTGLDVDIQGLLGEYAFSMLFGTAVEVYDTSCRSASTETRFDAILEPENWAVDVKTTVSVGFPLRVYANKMYNPPDAYALLIWVNSPPRGRDNVIDAVRDQLPIVEFRGFASSRTVFTKGHLHTEGMHRGRQTTTGLRAARPYPSYYTVEDCDLVDRRQLSIECQSHGTLRYAHAST